jgi:hypothetical protein
VQAAPNRPNSPKEVSRFACMHGLEPGATSSCCLNSASPRELH